VVGSVAAVGVRCLLVAAAPAIVESQLLDEAPTAVSLLKDHDFIRTEHEVPFLRTTYISSCSFICK
jgi:hypothetical protein